MIINRANTQVRPYKPTLNSKLNNMIDFSKILFLDIETTSQEKAYDQLNERMQKLWDKKAEQLNRQSRTQAFRPL